ncbi:MAG TPA: trypsin-like peptidase domain-containing protein [Gemmatimonadales bacterium]|jgi:serine protease Do
MAARILAALAAGPLGLELSELAESLRRITVQVHAGRWGHGSGVIWRRDGLIVTNAHVAAGAGARVRLADGRMLEARLVAREPDRDLAALRIPATGLPVARSGGFDALRPGELVAALGHPYGVPDALAIGVIHELTRDHAAPAWIRADIRLAPGNSGGPLADAGGRVLGINTLVAGGLGFAIPSPVVAGFLRRAGLVPPGERAA